MPALSRVCFGVAALLASLVLEALSPRVSGAVGAWTVETVDAFGLSPSLVLDRDGRPHIGYSKIREPMIATLGAGGWSYESLATPDNVPGATSNSASPLETQLIYVCLPSLGLDPETGEPRLAWVQSWDADLWYAQPAGSAWSYELVNGVASGPSLGVDGAGVVHLMFSDQYGVRSGGGWQLEPAGFTGAMALDFQGRPHALFATGPYGDKDLWYAARGANGWTSEPIATEGNAGLAATLALDGAGRPHVAFFDWTRQWVRYAVREESGWSFETIAGPVGHTSAVSIAVGAGGEPFVSYWHLDEGAQYFARRVAGVWVSEVVDSAGSVGGYCSLAIDAAGRPHLAYGDYYSNRLRYATRSDVVTGVPPAAPALGFALARAWPNPLRRGEALELALRLDAPRVVTIELLDMAGRRVDARGPEDVGAGIRILRWTPKAAGCGLYFVSVRSARGERRVSRVAVIR